VGLAAGLHNLPPLEQQGCHAHAAADEQHLGLVGLRGWEGGVLSGGGRQLAADVVERAEGVAQRIYQVDDVARLAGRYLARAVADGRHKEP
jgi:hypothetical protein